MGGKALDSFTRRFTKAEYKQFISAFLPALKQSIPSLQIKVVRSYADKSTFGDIDLIIVDTPTIKSELKEAFLSMGSKEVKIIRKMMFFELNELQVDINLVKQSVFDFSECFYAFNDLSSLILKKVCSSKKFMLREDGLTFDVKDNDNKFINRIVVTDNFNEVLQLFGYDESIYQNGFKSLDDIYLFGTSSKYFCPEKFSLDSFSKIDKESYESRKVFRYFVDRLNEKNTFIGNYDENRKFLMRAFELIPSFEVNYNKVLLNERNRLAAKEKFNGIVISKLTGLSGVDLGNFISILRKCAKSTGDEHEYIAQLSECQIKNWVINEFSFYEQTRRNQDG